MSRASKALELRVARALGGRRAGNTGQSHSDIVGVPWSVEVKYSKQGCVLTRWLLQARGQGKVEGRPWLLVVSQHRQRLEQATASMPFGLFLELAGLLPDGVAETGCSGAPGSNDIPAKSDFLPGRQELGQQGGLPPPLPRTPSPPGRHEGPCVVELRPAGQAAEASFAAGQAGTEKAGRAAL